MRKMFSFFESVISRIYISVLCDVLGLVAYHVDTNMILRNWRNCTVLEDSMT